MFGANPIKHVTEYHSSHFHKHRQNPRGKLGSVCFPTDIGSQIHLSAGNYLKHKATYTLELLTKTILNVPELPSYSFDLNQLENLWQDLTMAV
jgi:hypothetical protein